MLFIIMGLVLVMVGAEMNTKLAFGKLFVMGLLACAAGISAVLYTFITRLGKQQTRNIFYSVSVLIIIMMFAGSLYLDTPSDIFSRALILWLLGLSALLVITGNIAGILLHRFD